MAVAVVLHTIQEFRSVNRLTLLMYQGFQAFLIVSDRLKYGMIDGLTEQNLENQIQQGFQ